MLWLIRHLQPRKAARPDRIHSTVRTSTFNAIISVYCQWCNIISLLNGKSLKLFCSQNMIPARTYSARLPQLYYIWTQKHLLSKFVPQSNCKTYKRKISVSFNTRNSQLSSKATTVSNAWNFYFNPTPKSGKSSPGKLTRANIFGAFAKFRKAAISFVMSVRPSAWNNSAPTGRIFMKFGFLLFFQYLLRKLKFY
jgi:hypothetical protein